MKIEAAHPSQFERLVAVWESSVRATHRFLQESDIAALRYLKPEPGMGRKPEPTP